MSLNFIAGHEKHVCTLLSILLKIYRKPLGHKVVRQQNSGAVEDFILLYSAVYLRIQK